MRLSGSMRDHYRGFTAGAVDPRWGARPFAHSETPGLNVKGACQGCCIVAAGADGGSGVHSESCQVGVPRCLPVTTPAPIRYRPILTLWLNVA